MNNSTKGWIKLHRKLLDWEWYDDINTRLVFMHLLLTVNYEPSKYMGKTIEVGQRLFGRAKLASEIGVSEQQLRTALNRLKSTNEITIISTKQGSLVTIENWGSYQEKDSQDNQPTNQPTNQQLTNDQPTANQQLTIYKEVKNIRNKEDKNNIYIDDFEEFWKNYPVKASQGRKATKGSKEKAKQVYLNLVKKDETLISKINQGVQNYTEYLLGNPNTNQQPAYEGNKHVVTWLNQKTWQDEYITTKLINGEKNNNKSNMPDWQQKLNERYS